MCTAVFCCFLTTGVLEQLEVLLKDEDATVRKQTCELLHLICGHNIGRYYNTAILGCSTRQVLWLRRVFFFSETSSQQSTKQISFSFFLTLLELTVSPAEGSILPVLLILV